MPKIRVSDREREDFETRQRDIWEGEIFIFNDLESLVSPKPSGPVEVGLMTQKPQICQCISGQYLLS